MANANRQRSAAKGWVSRSVKTLDELVKQGKECDVLALEEAIQDFNKRIDTLDEAQGAVEAVVEEAELEKEIEEAADFRESLIRRRQLASKLLTSLTNADNADAESNMSKASSSPSVASTELTSVRLPKLELPRFDGTITKWQQFWDNFTAIVDSSELPNISKFTYLQSLLDGEAKRTVEGLALSSANYVVACKLLSERYGRRERIVFAHIQGLLSMGMLGHEQTSPTNELRKLQEELLTHIRSLEVWNVKGENYGVVLTPVILSRLPSDIRLEWAREGEGREDDLDFLLEFLKLEIERRERSESFKQIAHASNSNKVHLAQRERKQRQKQSKVPTASALQSTSVGACGFCNKVHPTETCPDVLKLDISDRQRRIGEARLCFRCLLPGHLARGCTAKCTKCGGAGHHQICCFTNGKKRNNDSSANMTVSTSRDNVEPKVALLCPTKQESAYTILQTAKVFVCGDRVVEATLLFDSGSDRTYVSSDLVKRARLKHVSSVNIAYAPFGGGKSGVQLRNVYELHAKGVYGGCGNFKSFTATEVPVICAPLCRPTLPGNLRQSMPKVKFADNYQKGGSLIVDILVGLDQYWRLIKQGVIRIAEGTVAQETEFGWILSGSCGSPSGLGFTEAHQLLSLGDLSEDTLKRFWDIESIGISPKEMVSDTDQCLINFEHTVCYHNGRYEVGLPWKEKKPVLLDNEGLARKRLVSLGRKLDRDPQLKVCYREVFRDLEQKGIIEEVLEDRVPHPVFYLPHHPVVKETSSTTKVRPVFDASAQGYNGVSLNDCLQSGPSLIPNLTEVLLRFRRWRFALTADISKAFLQIRLKREDQDVHRFLLEEGGVVRRMRFLRVTFGVTCSPFLLNATVKHHLSLYPEGRVVEELQSNLYVDDWLSGADSEEEAISMFSEAKSVMAQAGMVLAKWSSNSKVVCDKVGTVMSDSTHNKILGVVWIPGEDCFTFEGVSLPEMVVPTKRVVLSFIARLFDPIGLLTPYVLVAKILFQELWALGLQWDEEVPPTVRDRFISWLFGLEVLKKWRIPRQFARVSWNEAEQKGLHLHVFGDASEKGYGAVAYLCVPLDNGTFSSSLVMSKAKVAPVKKLTLPRLELLGCLLVARLLRFVRQALQLSDTVAYTCWTDSTVALSWVKGDPQRWKQFVANRVTEIQDLSDPACWKHCPGKDNPADLTSRGVLAEVLVESELWLVGPPWLSSPLDVPFRGCSETELVVVAYEAVSLACGSSKPEEVFRLKRWGSFTKALHVVAWVKRFLHNIRQRNDRHSGLLTYAELSEAKVMLFRQAQCLAFADEIEALERGKHLPKGSCLRKLDPFKAEDGLLRVKGRLQLSELSFEEKHPAILPSGHLAKLIVRHQHLFLKHAGVDLVITSLRASYWIVGLRVLVKKVKRECFACQRVDSKACNEPVAPLPKLRVSEAPPFTVTGVDFAGPLFCVDFPGMKFYICLFTCAVVRAVHLELTQSLSTSDFILALRRFAARRGLPTVLYSDNARTFQGAEAQMAAYFGHLCPEWKWIAPRAPWWGGWWERLVRSVKVALRKSVGGRCLTRSELETTLQEIEGCINSRPLSFVGDEVDCVSPLTPNHFLLGRAVGFQGRILEDPEAISQGVLRERECKRIERLDRFWAVWRTEYLRNLPRVVENFKGRGGVKIGSVVLIREDGVPRMQWDLGVVKEMYPGKDGIVRSVKLHTGKGSFKVRAIQRLHDMELVNLESPVHDLQTERVDPPEGSKQPHLPSEPDIRTPPSTQTTRSGRIVKTAVRLDL